MTYSRLVRKFGSGMILYALSYLFALLAIFGLLQYTEVFTTHSPHEIGTLSISLAAIIVGSTLAMILMLLGLYRMRSSVSRLGEFIEDLKPLKGAIDMIIYALILQIVAFYLYIYTPLIGFYLFFVVIILFLIGYVLLGSRLNLFKNYGVDPGAGATLIYWGGILMFLAGLGGFLVRLGFLLAGFALRSVPVTPEHLVEEIAKELEDLVITQERVALLDYAAKRGVNLIIVLDAAYKVFERRGFRVIAGLLTKY